MELAERGHLAMADRYRLGAELDGGEAEYSRDGLMYAWRSDLPVLMNGAVPFGDGDPSRLVAGASRWFGERGRGFSLFARTDTEVAAAVDAGMHLVIERYPAMVLRQRVGGQSGDVAGLRRVTNLAEAGAFLRAVDAAFVAIGMPAGVLGDLRPEALVDREDTAAFAVFDAGDRAVAAASVVVARGIAGIQWVGVVEEARGRGLASAVTAAAADAGFAMGADCAWLEASSMGEPVYARMGFEELFSYRVYMAAPPG